MLFDWFTMGAQVLNFVVLVWLMKHFLYQPILNAIDKREKLITKEISDAKTAKIEAQNEHDKFRDKNIEFDKKSAELLSQATAAVEKEKARLMEDALNASKAWSLKRETNLLNEEKDLHQAVSHRTQEEIFSIARKTLSDLAGLELEKCMVDLFLQKLRELPKKEIESQISQERKLKSTAIVRSAFNLIEPQRILVEKTIKELFGSETEVHFEISSGLISGIVLIKNDMKIAWCIDDYLESMQTAVEETLKNMKIQNAKRDSSTAKKVETESPLGSETQAEKKDERKSEPALEPEPEPDSKDHTDEPKV